ncbi:glycosyltransferase [Nocardioides dongxiaopingii]|uniref:glycosyltransferase n=1 Tax=Nocardioides TaxID=1839 RepID=UPI0010C76E5B|nr:MULTISPECIES: glycosyltransferase [Nocardioides]QCW49344.1 glycosyltransferase [Nocardioides sp. S-1144]
MAKPVAPGGGDHAVTLVHVVVPVHDEAALLPACLASLHGALDRLRAVRPDVVARLTVVLDACTDQSGAVCARWAVDVVEEHAANVGAARASGTRRAHDLADADGVDPRRVWVACTDADTAVPLDWLTDQVEVAEAGADLVLGRVEPDRTASPEVVAAWRAAHADRRVRTYGAHLGFRLAAYDAVGGFAPLREHEDADLVGRLLDHGVPWAAAPRPVVTSSRLLGRTPGGFSAYLAALRPSLGSAPPEVAAEPAP